MASSRRPSASRSFPGPSGLHVPVLGHEIIVILVDKLMISHLPEHSKGDYYEKKADY
jgi:hypothetical protein